MGLIALASAKGSPGVTTTALVLGALWPRPVLLAECDPSGGDVALRMSGPEESLLNADRGLVSLTAAGRSGLSDEVILSHRQELDGGLEALLGVRSPEQMAGMGALWDPLSESLSEMYSRDVIADCGRIGPQSPQMALLRAADLVVLVCRPSGSAVVHLRDRLSALVSSIHGHLGVILVAGTRQREAVDQVWDVLTRLQLPTLQRWQLAFDPAGAAFFENMGHGNLARTLLVRTGREIATQMAATVPFQGEDPGYGADQFGGHHHEHQPAGDQQPAPTWQPPEQRPYQQPYQQQQYQQQQYQQQQYQQQQYQQYQQQYQPFQQPYQPGQEGYDPWYEQQRRQQEFARTDQGARQGANRQGANQGAQPGVQGPYPQPDQVSGPGQANSTQPDYQPAQPEPAREPRRGRRRKGNHRNDQAGAPGGGRHA